MDYSPWGCKESDMTESLNNNYNILNRCCSNSNVPQSCLDGSFRGFAEPRPQGLGMEPDNVLFSQILHCCWSGNDAWRTAVLHQHFSNFSVHGDHLESLLKSRF